MAKKSTVKSTVKGVTKDFTENTKYNATIRFNKNAVLSLELDNNSKSVDLSLTNTQNENYHAKAFLMLDHIFD